jgi:hypothetical protein
MVLEFGSILPTEAICGRVQAFRVLELGSLPPTEAICGNLFIFFLCFFHPCPLQNSIWCWRKWACELHLQASSLQLQKELQSLPPTEAICGNPCFFCRIIFCGFYQWVQCCHPFISCPQQQQQWAMVVQHRIRTMITHACSGWRSNLLHQLSLFPLVV